MSTAMARRLTSSVSRHTLLGVAGIALVGFIIVHLAGNFNMFIGPEAMNHYAEKLRSFGPLLWVARLGLIAAFGAHIVLGIGAAIENRMKRKRRYAVQTYRSDKTIATRTMALTGSLIALFLLLHLYDFTFSSHEGPGSVVNGQELGLYGVVFNAFSQGWRVIFYVLVMCALGLHLSHAISSVCVTLGVESRPFVKKMDTFGKVLGILIAVGFSSIPIYIYIRAHWMGG